MKGSVSLLVASLLLAGCAGTGEPQPDEEAAATGLQVDGIVQSLAYVPIAGAEVRFQEANVTTTTGPDGRFTVTGLAEALHTVQASAAGYQPATLLAQPRGGIVGLDFQLTPIPNPQPRNETLSFKGTLQCAAEYLIVSPSCDSVIVFVNDELEANGNGRPLPEPLEQEAQFEFEVESGWKTLVIDVVFDPEESPGLDGLRISLQGVTDQDALGTYEMYGRFFGPEPFSARVDPNATYPEGVRPVPENATTFQIEVYPQSHAWHAVCVPPGSDLCFLGVGAGIDVTFQVLVTAFYIEPAPEGWTMLAG